MRRFSTVLVVSLILAGAPASTGCLQKEVTHTVYVGPASVVWSVLEKDVRSDETSAGGRYVEEQDYTLGVAAGRHGVAEAFRRLGAQATTTTWLRRERPYTVMTEARFADLRAVAAAILREARVQGDATLVREGCHTTFAVRLDVESAEGNGDDALDALLADLEDYRVVLTEGRFVSADGFTLGGDGAAAAPDPAKKPENGVLTLALTWSDVPCRSQADLSSR